MIITKEKFNVKNKIRKKNIDRIFTKFIEI